MPVEDQRDFITFYGIVYNDWKVTFGKFSDVEEQLVTDYISIDCDCEEKTQATATATDYRVNLEFMFPHHIKKQYYIEGVAEGEFTVACNGDDSYITDYKITICRTNADKSYEELNSTGWIAVNKDLTWDAGNSIGEEAVFHWRIEIWETAIELKEEDRFYIKIEIRGSNNHLYLMHSNDPEWTDVWAKIPFRL